MSKPDFDFDDDGANTRDVAGTPQGDGDFETDNLPSTGETSSGGQLKTGDPDRVNKAASRTQVPGPNQPTGLEKVIDEISNGKLLP